MSARWKVSVIREPDPPPFDHGFQLSAVGCECTPWVCRSIQAAVRLVDILEFHAAHPELPAPKGSVAIHVAHSVGQQTVA